MRKLLQGIIRKIRRILPVKRPKSGYKSFDVQFRTAYGKPEKDPKKKRLPVSALTTAWQKKTKVKEESYRRKEREKRVGLRLVAGIALVAAVAIIIWHNGGSGGWRALVPGISFFQLHRLDFNGCSVTTEAVLRERAGLTLYQTNLLTLDTGKVEKLIAEDPWVSSVKVSRNWPSGLTVAIVEHAPLALMSGTGSGGSGLSFIDSSGVAFMVVSPGQDIDYPVISGLERIQEPEQRQEIFFDIVQFLKQAEKNNPNLPTQAVSEIHVNQNGGLVIFLVEYPFPIFFGRGQAEKKYNRLVKVLEVLYKKHDEGMQISQVEYIRMDYLNDKVLVAQSGSG